MILRAARRIVTGGMIEMRWTQKQREREHDARRVQSDSIAIGEIIKTAIDKKHPSIAEFARHAGINEAVVYSHTSGRKSPSVSMLLRYAKGLGMNLVIEFGEVGKKKDVNCSKYQELYQELIHEVQMKIPGESRHETAHRIIRQHEIGGNTPLVPNN